MAVERIEERIVLSTFGVTHLPGTADVVVASPAISDGGGRIAFITDADLTGQNTELRPSIFYYDTRSSTYTQVTDASLVTQHLAMSGDGKRISFVAAANLTGENADGNFEIFLYDIPSQTLYQVTNTLDPNMSQFSNKTNLWLNETGTRLMYFASEDVSYRPDVFRHSIRLATALTTFPTDTTVIDLGEAQYNNVAGISYSRDGFHIAFTSSEDRTGNGTNTDGNSEIFLYDFSGAAPSVRQITVTEGEVDNFAPALNSDGTRVSFSSNADYVGGGSPRDLHFVFLYDTTTGNYIEIPDTDRGGVSTLDARGNRVVDQSVSGLNLIYDVVSGESTNLGGSPYLPTPEPQDPWDPATEVPISPELGMAMSANGRFIAFAGAGFDENGDLTTGVFYIVELFPPVVTFDGVTTDEDTNVEFNVLDNDYDPNGGSLIVLTVGGEELHGHVTFNNNGNLIYRPDENFYGFDAFTYVAENDAGLKTRGTVLIAVRPVNDAPEAVTEDYYLNEDHVASHLGSVLDNDSDVDGDVLTAKLIRGTAHGKLTLEEDGSFSYTPDDDYYGSDSFTYQASDGLLESGVATVSITVYPVNDTPSFSMGGDQSVPEDAGPQSVAGFALGMSAGPANESGQTLTFLVATNNDALFTAMPSIDATTGELTYTPATDANGVANVSVRLMDNGGTADGGIDTSPSRDFVITVLSPTEQADNLIDNVQLLFAAGVFGLGQADALNVTLNKVQQEYALDRTQVALNVLNAFTNQVQALVQGGVLTTEQGQSLLDAADELKTSLETTSDNQPLDEAFAALGTDGLISWL